MDWINIIVAIIGGIGLGNIITHYLSGRENKKERIFNKKEEAYLGLLHSIYLAAIEPSEKSSKNYALWQTRVSIVGSPDVIKFAKNFVDNLPNSQERYTAFDNLVNSIRNDLNIDTRKIKQ